MAAWTGNELDKIDAAEELQLASLRSDGTRRDPVTMWVVRVGDNLYVRAYKGRNSPWFRGARTRHEAHVEAGGVGKDVTLVEDGQDAALNDRIDAAYRSKYRRYSGSIVDSVVTGEARQATLRLAPR